MTDGHRLRRLLEAAPYAWHSDLNVSMNVSLSLW